MNPKNLLRLPRGLITAQCAAVALSMGVDLKTVLSAPSVTPRLNSAYIDAPYEASFLLFVQRHGDYYKWSRKRRLKWKRRQMKKARAFYALKPPSPIQEPRSLFHSEMDLLLGGFPMAKLLAPE